MIAPDTDTSAATTTETLLDVATEAITLLRLADETVGVAESLTAGGVMAAITNVPGASSAFRGGVVSYATELKQSLLNVDPALIQREGVIHGDVAAQMAEGARTVTSFPDSKPTTWGIGTTGVAGPAMQDGKPVGMVFIGIASVGQETCAWGPFMFPGDREAIRQATVKTALGLLRDQLKVRLEDGERKNVN
ncbi:putative competence/damage-inducible protein CinA [Podospora didyma]|uniref:Competence/damage-inducible protein CinA n=1 Tax=Podospora didyma TaxID=330526 RepID=A0AAE0NFZ4_9PEZI|nr:putative competence/damage-inducible protein CinA [Podospora didyma]